MEIIVVKNGQLRYPVQGVGKDIDVLVVGQLIVTPAHVTAETAETAIFTGKALRFEVGDADIQGFDAKPFMTCHEILQQQFLELREALYEMLEQNRYITLSLLMMKLNVSRERTKGILAILVQYQIIDKYYSYWRRSAEWIQWYDAQKTFTEPIQSAVEELQNTIVQKKNTLHDIMNEVEEED